MKFVSIVFTAGLGLFGLLTLDAAAASIATTSAHGPLLDLVGKPCKQYAAPQLGGEWKLACESYQPNSKNKQCARWGLLCEPVPGTKP